MINNISIHGYMGLSDIKINDCKRINLLVGKNDSGKTSILEGILILCYPTLVPAYVTILNDRQIIVENADTFGVFFHNLDIKSDIVISGVTTNEQKRTCRIKAQKRASSFFSKSAVQRFSRGAKTMANSHESGTTQTETATPLSGLTDLLDEHISSAEEIESVKLEFFTDNAGDGNPYENQLKMNHRLNIEEHETVYKTTGFIRAFYNSTLQYLKDPASLLHSEIVSKRKSKILEVLRAIEPNLTDLEIGGDGKIYCDIGLDNLLPFGCLGDGIARIFTYILSFPKTENGIVLIDELENGLHYSSLGILWKAIIQSAREFDTQVFATTHSIDCIKSLVHVANDIATMYDDEIRVFRIERENDAFQVTGLTIKDVQTSLEEGWEIR